MSHWRVDTTQHIHVEPQITEADVLIRATGVATQSANGSPLVLDLWALPERSCSCEVPEGWKTYQVLLYVYEAQPQQGSNI